jgi:hypothetical protein
MVVPILVGVMVVETVMFLYTLYAVGKYAITLENKIKARAQYDAAVMKQFKKAISAPGVRLGPPTAKAKKSTILN